MNEVIETGKCSALNRDGSPCQAWPVVGSSPPLCAPHQGLNVGAGAPPGNQNALKHGYYVRGLRPEELQDIEALQDRSLLGELVLARVMLMRLLAQVNRPDCTPAEAAAVTRHIFTGIRTIRHLLKLIGDGYGAFWDEVLDELGAELGVEL